MSKPRRVQVGQNRPRLYGGRPPATVYARCFTAILKRQRKLRLLVLADRCMAPSFWTTVASWWRIGRCCGMISAASRKLTPLTRAKVGKWLAHLNNPPAAAWPRFQVSPVARKSSDRWSQLAKVLMPKDYINFMLTGAMATDYSEASCYFLMDSETRSWSSQACETFGLRVDQLPELNFPAT